MPSDREYQEAFRLLSRKLVEQGEEIDHLKAAIREALVIMEIRGHDGSVKKPCGVCRAIDILHKALGEGRTIFMEASNESN